jgi:hypothetical protein
MPILERKPIFGAHKGGKEACRKRRKINMQKKKEKNMWKEEKQHGTHADKPNHVRVRVLDMNVMAISQ